MVRLFTSLSGLSPGSRVTATEQSINIFVGDIAFSDMIAGAQTTYTLLCWRTSGREDLPTDANVLALMFEGPAVKQHMGHILLRIIVQVRLEMISL